MGVGTLDLLDLARTWPQIRLESHPEDGWRLLLKRDFTVYCWKGKDIDALVHRAWMEEPPDITADIDGGLWL